VIAAAPPVALAVSPARLALAAGETRELRIANRGGTAAVVTVTTAGYTHALRGRIVILPRSSAATVLPRHVVVPARGSVSLTVRGQPGTPGDHPSLVLLATQRSAGDIAVRVRVGVLVLVRSPGRVLHRVALERLETAGGRLRLWLRNRGNVAEPLRIHVVVAGRVLRDSLQLLPRSRALAELRAGLVHGTAPVSIRVRYGGGVLRRTARLRF
jgi:hypothetical protein